MLSSRPLATREFPGPGSLQDRPFLSAESAEMPVADWEPGDQVLVQNHEGHQSYQLLTIRGAVNDTITNTHWRCLCQKEGETIGIETSAYYYGTGTPYDGIIYICGRPGVVAHYARMVFSQKER